MKPKTESIDREKFSYCLSGNFVCYTTTACTSRMRFSFKRLEMVKLFENLKLLLQNVIGMIQWIEIDPLFLLNTYFESVLNENLMALQLFHHRFYYVWDHMVLVLSSTISHAQDFFYRKFSIWDSIMFNSLNNTETQWYFKKHHNFSWNSINATCCSHRAFKQL